MRVLMAGHKSLDKLYKQDLFLVKGVNFTFREVDIIACVLHNRGEKKIASICSIAPKTVSAHIYNIMGKLRCNSKDQIIDFIESSGKLPIFREYYLQLLIKSNFEKLLIKMANQLNKESVTCYCVRDDIVIMNDSLYQEIQKHLRLSGIKLVEITPANLSDGHYKTELILNLSSITEENYYFDLFDLIARISANDKAQEILKEFKETCQTIHNINDGKTSIQNFDDTKQLSLTLLIGNKHFTIFAILALSIMVMITASFIYKQPMNQEKISMDLALPQDTLLLEHESILAQIDKKLSGKNGIKTVVLVGVGGSGKTTIAHQYARNPKNTSSLIWQINAETKETIISSIKQLAYALCRSEEEKQALTTLLQTPHDTEREKKLLEFTRTRVMNYSDWLLIYDNVGTFNDIKDYFQYDSKVWGSGRIIITTRDSNIAYSNYIPRENVIHICELTKEEKLELFQKIIGDDKDLLRRNNLENIEFLDKLPPFPFDISLAANHIKATRDSYGKYLQNLAEQKEPFILSQKVILNDIGEYNQTRYDIVTLSLKQLIDMDLEFKDLLVFISLINHDNIPKDLLVAYKGEIVVSRFIHALKKFSLVTEQFPSTRTSTATLSIHRATQDIMLIYLFKLLKLGQNTDKLEKMAEILENYMFNELGKPNNYKMTWLFSHAEKFLEHHKLQNQIIISNLATRLGSFYFFAGNYNKSETYFKQALACYEKHYGKDHIKTAAAYRRLGANYRNKQDYQQALQFLEYARKIYEKHYGKEHIETMEVYMFLGSVYRNIGDFEIAQKLLEQALSVYEKNYGKEHIDTTRVLAYLGINYRKIGNYNKAKEYLEHALTTYKHYYGDDHTKTAWLTANLGILYEDIGNYDKAKELFEQALLIYQKTQEQNCMEVAWALAHLGNVNALMGKNILALNNLQKSLDIYRNHFDSDDHITVAWVLSNLGKVHQNLGDYNKVKALWDQILPNYKIIYGENHVYTAIILNNLGNFYLLQNDLETAEKFFNMALEIFQNSNHPLKYISLESLAELYLKKSLEIGHHRNISLFNQFQFKSIEYFQNALETLATHLPKDSPHIIRIQSKIKKITNT